jgi:hypothetical protein
MNCVDIFYLFGHVGVCYCLLYQVPETLEYFVPTVPTLLDEKHHGAMLSAVTFIVEAIRLEPKLKKTFKRVRGLNYYSYSYSSLFLINGVVGVSLCLRRMWVN